ncbi:hypothetical protein SBF1_780010 [Candidatus Desulfosporosinus infrequens]|uniref:Uncharacterized protein n=1 Tax=Candidatus Desulfosporosinus infrequens TaxID=2043169 RepID=A0A2U3LRU7_9FIRM|nr:hypothetical protein SBF1_780010 [Candidatus Desulfosporosinus infrequens]
MPHQEENRESGESPVRSRHCDRRATAKPPVNPLIWEGAVSDDPEPGDLPIEEYCPNVEFGMCCFTERKVKSSAN